jgi:hypothetical protein
MADAQMEALAQGYEHIARAARFANLVATGKGPRYLTEDVGGS